MSGGPVDGCPWWAKALYYCIAMPAVAVVDGAKALAAKLKPKDTRNYFQVMMDDENAKRDAEMAAINKRIDAARKRLEAK